MKALRPYLGSACFHRFVVAPVVPHRPRGDAYGNRAANRWSSTAARLRELAVLTRKFKDGRTKNLEHTERRKERVLAHLEHSSVPKCVTKTIQHHIENDKCIRIRKAV